VKWILAAIAAVGLIGAAVVAYVAGQKEIAEEREREEPIKTPPRITRGANGEVIVKLDEDTQSRIGLKTEIARSQTIYPETPAYGHLQEDPGMSFIVRAPVAGTLHSDQFRDWPRLGENLSDGISFGIVEPRLVPFERVDVGNRLTNAQADVELLRQVWTPHAPNTSG
jgi:hypothetical protein